MNGHHEPITLRPWARDNVDSPSLQDVLARVNLERGHFRDINEASLQEEIAAEGGLESSDSDGDLSDNEEDEEPKQVKASTREDLYRLKHEMLGFISQAEQDVLKSLDFVSLLESAHNTNGAVTVSQVLKQTVPLGSLGTDIWHRMPEDKTRQAQEKLMASSIRLQGLQKSADALLSAATRLEETARTEAKYWEEILAVSEKGWSISRIRQRSHLLGVHFGFNGSLPAFARRDLAALVTSSDGDITLERGIGTKPMTMRVVVRDGDRIIGTSKLPAGSDASQETLDARIRHARDSLYDEELNHELLRESRDMAAMEVMLKGSKICFSMPSSLSANRMQVSFELVSLDRNPDTAQDILHDKDQLAESVLLAARLLLSQSHRERLKSKAAIPRPISENHEPSPKFPILKPLVWMMRHIAVVDYLNQHLTSLAHVLRCATLDVSLAKLAVAPPSLSTISTIETLVTTLLRPLQSTAVIEVRGAPNVSSASAAAAAADASHTEPSADSSAAKLVADTSLLHATGCLFSCELTNSPSPRRSEYHSVLDLLPAFDDLVSEMLTNVLADILGRQQWRCDARALEVRRLRQVANESQVSRISVMLDSQAQTLTLKSSTQQVEWKVDGAEKRTFRDAANALAAAAG